MPSLHTYLIQEAIDQGQIGGRAGGKNGGCLFGTDQSLSGSRLCSAGGRLQERERQALKSFFVYPKPLQGTPAHNSCPQSCPLCYHGRECRELLRQRSTQQLHKAANGGTVAQGRGPWAPKHMAREKAGFRWAPSQRGKDSIRYHCQTLSQLRGSSYDAYFHHIV